MTVAQHVRKKISEYGLGEKACSESKSIIYEEVKPEPNNNFLSKFLGSSLLIMTIATFYLLMNKNYVKSSVAITRPVVNMQYQQSNGQPNRLDIGGINSRLEKIENEIKTYNHRVWLLAVAHNENVNLAKQQGVCAPQSFVYFNDQWKLNRMPQTMTMSELQRFELQTSIFP
jgi:hypothetical protein